MPSTNLQRTMGTATNAKKGTLSFWAKLAKSNNANEYMRFVHIGGTSNDFGFYIISDTLRWYIDAGTNGYGDAGGRLLRDYSAYYHIVVAIDSTLSTGADRIKCWINGELQSSTQFPQALNITQNADVFDSSHVYSIGATDSSNLAQAFAGILSHFHFIDGTAYQASDFGEYDANGVWKIKTDVSVTYGTNGFFILKDGNSVTDQSGNGNNFTVAGGTLTNTEDSPSNVFTVWSPLHTSTQSTSNVTWKYGNTGIANAETGGAYPQIYSTLAVSSGKYYFETKLISESNEASLVGISGAVTTEPYIGANQYTYAYRLGNGQIRNNDTESAFGNTCGVNDILMVAVDLDNNKLYFGINGTWQNSGDPTSGATGTGAYTITSADNTPHGVYHFTIGDIVSTGTFEHETNFGNGYFGTTAVASAGTNASGNGIFEYDVPTGYTALSTKGLNL